MKTKLNLSLLKQFNAINILFAIDRKRRKKKVFVAVV